MAIMTKSRQPKLFDLVAVTHCPAGEAVEVGDVGTVIELLPPDGIEVEFLHCDGRTRCVATLQYNDILVLNRERTKVA
jgi:catabolite regulation protein CreA